LTIRSRSRRLARGGERGPVEDDPDLGDRAVDDGEALGPRGVGHRDGVGVGVGVAVVSSPKAAIRAERVTICVNGSMNARKAPAPSSRAAGAWQTMSSAMKVIARSKSWLVHAW